MRTGGTILADLAENTDSDATPRDIVSNNLSESTQNLIGKVLRGRRRKRKGNTTARTRRKEKAQPTNKRDINS